MKNKSILNKMVVIAIISITVFGCQNATDVLKNVRLDLPNTPFEYGQVELNGQKSNLKELINDQSREFFNDHTATLGRVLFYERALSINNSVSCGSCHQQSKAFTDGRKHSVGFGGKLTPRNTPSILNTFSGGSLFWDVRARGAVDLSLEPVFNHLEMGIESDEMLVKKVKELSYYPALFEKAFSKSEINKQNISIAIASFMNSIATDNLMATITGEKWNNQFKNNDMVMLSKSLFLSNRTQCATCHTAESTSSFRNGFPGIGDDIMIGGGFDPDFGGGYQGGNAPLPDVSNIGLDFNYSDNGAGDGNFKIPNLMNVFLTAPYMHDGRYKTLEEVVEHYNTGVRKHAKLDPKFLDNGKIKTLNLTRLESAALVAFMKSLKTEGILTDPKFSDPFIVD